MYKLLALDLDGTLLNEKHEISESNRVMIQEARKRGVKIVLVSGREPMSVKQFSSALNLDELIACLNGGLITDNNEGKIYLNECLDEGLARNIIHLLEKMHIYSAVFVQDRIFVPDYKNSRLSLLKKYTLGDVDEVGKLPAFLDNKNLWSKINKVLLIDENKILSNFKDVIIEKYNGIKMQFSLSFFLEIYSNKISKGKALKYISDYYGIERKEIIAIGDGENDIDMFKFAGLGVAMENATNLVKENADIITFSNKEDGVSHIIKNFLLDN